MSIYPPLILGLVIPGLLMLGFLATFTFGLARNLLSWVKGKLPVDCNPHT